MCGRYIEIQKIEVIEKRFNVSLHENSAYHPSFNISPGKPAPVITNEEPELLQSFQFGLTPHWAKKNMYLFNARSEGDHNKDNHPNYKGTKGIIKKPAFRKSIRSKRCLVIADAFIEGTTKERLDKPFVVYLKGGIRPFAFAGIWDEWVDNTSGEVIKSFSIITTTSNELIRMIPHHRSPVILEPENEKKWLNPNTGLDDILGLLKPYPAEKMNAYPITPEIKDVNKNKKELIQPVGERLTPENDISLSKELKLLGMGNSRKK